LAATEGSDHHPFDVTDSFSIFWITDTQYLASQYPQKGNDLTNWIVANAGYYNLRMVIHTGDFVDNNDVASEWNAADTAMSALFNNNIPYCWCAGNHDQQPWCNPNGTWIGNQYPAFNLSTTGQKPHWTSSVCDGKSTAVHFNVNNVDFLVINIEYCANSTALIWAEGILDANPNAYVIFATHAYMDHHLDYDNNLLGTADWARNFNNTMLVNHPNIAMVLNGHDHGEHVAHMTVGSTNELVFDRQESESNMGAASAVVLTFNITGNQIRVQTYDLVTGQFLTDQDDQFIMSTIFRTAKTITVPDDYTTIQGAIDAARIGDTVLVRAGTYFENVVVDKTLLLAGENAQNTTIDGGGTGNVLKISADGVNVTGFTIQNGGTGTIGNVFLTEASHCVITENRIRDTRIIDNCGVLLEGSSSHNVLDGNIIEGNRWGVELENSCNNSLNGNTITNNTVGVHFSLSSSRNNEFYHNNFSNLRQVENRSSGNANVWDDGYPSGGNYWSGYTVSDGFSGPSQDALGSDGIGDLPYSIDGDNFDRYPLMKPYAGLVDLGIAELEALPQVVRQGLNATVTCRVVNYGIESLLFNASLEVNGTPLASFTDVPVEGRNSIILGCTWNTSSVDTGNYTVIVEVSRLENESDLADNIRSLIVAVISNLTGDINGDSIVDMKDVSYVSRRFLCLRGDPLWDSVADINSDGKINMMDIGITARHLGEHYP